MDKSYQFALAMVAIVAPPAVLAIEVLQKYSVDWLFAVGAIIWLAGIIGLWALSDSLTLPKKK